METEKVIDLKFEKGNHYLERIEILEKQKETLLKRIRFLERQLNDQLELQETDNINMFINSFKK